MYLSSHHSRILSRRSLLNSLSTRSCSSVVKSEHVIEAEEAGRSTREQVEDLSKLHRVFTSVDVEIARDKAQDAVVHWGLGIETLNLMLYVAKGWELLDDLCDTLELFTFEGEHGVISVELLELWAVGVKHGVVVLHELRANGGKVHLILEYIYD